MKREESGRATGAPGRFAGAWMRRYATLFRICRLLACAASVFGFAAPAPAQSPNAAAPDPGLGTTLRRGDPKVDQGRPAQTPADPPIAIVEGHPIYLSQLGRAAQALPDNLRGLSFDTLYPVLLDRIVDHEALVTMARRRGLESRPDVQQEIQAATDRILEGAYLSQDANPGVTEAAILARYKRQFANRPAAEEVRARHILVSSEGEARKVLDDLRKGADFATVARVLSKDPDGANGGDLGFFRREQVWPSFGDVAFSLQPGQVAPDPVKNEFGWHIIKVDEKRLVAPPSYSEVHDQLQQELLAAAVSQSVEQARAQLSIRRFNIDGSTLDTGPKLKIGGSEAPPAE
jgi:peptidyl-prolyl cis-trans isomerase C